MCSALLLSVCCESHKYSFVRARHMSLKDRCSFLSIQKFLIILWISPWIYNDSNSMPMNRVHLILMTVKWQIESSAALWIFSIISYLLWSNMIKVMENVLNVIGWYGYKADDIKFLWIWFWIIRWGKKKNYSFLLYTVYMLLVSRWWGLHIPSVVSYHVPFQYLSLLGLNHYYCTFIFWVSWNWES